MVLMLEKMYEISLDIIMPTYERYDMFVRAANSVGLAISLGLVNNLIIADDSDTDKIELWCQQKSWVKYRRVTNRNPGLNRNDCALRSNACYLLYLDSDNVIENFDNLEHLRRLLRVNSPDLVSISCGGSNTSSRYIKKGLHWVGRKYYYNNYIGEVQHLIKRELLLNEPYIVLKGHTLDAPDYLWSRIIPKLHSHLFFPDTIQNYTLSEDSLSNIGYRNKIDAQLFNYIKSFQANWKNGYVVNLLMSRIVLRILFYRLLSIWFNEK